MKKLTAILLTGAIAAAVIQSPVFPDQRLLL